MHLRLAGLFVVASSTVIAASLAGPIPPGRQYRLTIEGANTVTFIPQMNLPEMKVDYQVKVEYIVDSRYGKEPKPSTSEDKDQDKDDDPAEKAVVKTTPSNPKKSKTKKADNPAQRVTGAIDLSLHSTERTIRENGQAIVEMRANRSRVQGKLLPEMPGPINVGVNEAPPRLQEIMKGFDVIVASLLLNDDLKVINRKFRNEGPQRALTETILSIHAPLPRTADSWESPTQIFMGQGQTAKGMLRFERIKPPPVAAKPTDDKEKDKEKGKEPEKVFPQVKVKVSGTLKAEGVVAGRFVKDGTYTVTGEQTFDTKTFDWVASRWSVVIDNELANPNGQTIARAKGTMIIESKALDAQGPATATDPKASSLKP